MIKMESPNNSGNFIVTPYRLDGEKIISMVNRIGPYDGWQVAPDLGALEIVSDSSWTVTVYEWSIERMIERGLILFNGESFSGSGDSVVLLGPNSDEGGHTNGLVRMKVNNTGPGNFVVRWIVFGESVDILINEIGDYEGTVPIRDMASLVIVESEGDWTLDTSGE